MMPLHDVASECVQLVGAAYRKSKTKSSREAT